jgi:hypothetical protein
MVSVRPSVWTKIGQCLENSFSQCPFLVECFGGWGKGEPGEARGWGGRQGGPAWAGGGARVGKDRARGGASTGEGEGTERGELDGCIMHRVHTTVRLD